jgi:hypothetical protein
MAFCITQFAKVSLTDAQRRSYPIAWRDKEESMMQSSLLGLRWLDSL